MNPGIPSATPPADATEAVNVDLATVRVTAFDARQRVNRWVLQEIGNQLRGATPELLIGDHPCWLVPVELTAPVQGAIGRVGLIRVDATTGELVADAETIRELTENAGHLVDRASL